MLRTFTADKERLKLFFKVMYERQLIWYKRFILKLPQEQWTDDEIYKKNRFTNVYRDLDRTSQYLLNNIILNKSTWHKYDNERDNNVNLIWKILFFRMINNPRIFTSIDVIADYNEYDADKFYDYLKENVVDKGVAFAHGAFCQYSKHDVIDDGKELHFDNMSEYFAKFTIAKLHNYIEDIYKLMQDSFTNNNTADEFIDYMSKNIEGCGRFIAHEFFQDLCCIERYTGLKLMSWNAMNATNAGPGSTGGSKYIFSDVKSSKDVIDSIKYLHSIADEQLKEIQKEYFPETNGFYYVGWNLENKQYEKTCFNFTLSQIEHYLCEFYKYTKYLEAEGKVRARIYVNNKSHNELMY